MKVFKHQITLKVYVSKDRGKKGREFTTVHFNSTAKTVININKYGLNKYFQQVLYR